MPFKLNPFTGNLDVVTATPISAPVDAQYVTLTTNATLTNERVLTGTTNQINITDNGAGSTVVLSTPQDIHTGASPTFVGLTLSGKTQGSILFVGSGGLITEDNTYFFFDDNVSGKTLVFPNGTTAQGGSNMAIRAVTNATTVVNSFEVYNSSKTTSRGSFDFKRARGTFASQSFAQNGDALGSFTFQANIGGDTWGYAGKIIGEADGTIAGGASPGRIRILTQSSGNWLENNLIEALRIDSAQNVGIGITSITAKLHLKAGTATASTAPLKFTSGTNLTTAEAGAMEWDGTNLFITQTSGPTRKTLAYTTDIPSGAALTKTDDTNVTLTLGGSPTTALVNAASLTIGWTGTLAISRGGTGSTTAGGAKTALGIGYPLFDHYTDAGNLIGTGETDLYSDSTAANTFTNNGDKVRAQYAGIQIVSATASKEWKVYFAGTIIFDSGSFITSTTAWDIKVIIIKDTSSSVRCSVVMNGTNSVGTKTFFDVIYTNVSGLTFSGTNILKITGQSSGTGSADNDIVAKEGYIEFIPAA